MAGRTVAGYTAVAAAAVYVALNGSWIAAVAVGDNTVTTPVALAGIGLALAATRPWGVRLRARVSGALRRSTSAAGIVVYSCSVVLGAALAIAMILG